MTETSLLPKAAAAAGLNYAQYASAWLIWRWRAVNNVVVATFRLRTRLKPAITE